MAKFDRYLLSQLLALFGFFSLVLVAVYWVNMAVNLFDRLIGDGQSALVFLEFSLLTLPNVIRLVLPVSSFAAAVYVANRLMQDSELVVMQATGFSAFRLARPALAFGLIAALMMAILMNLLVPESRARLATRSAEISENLTARFLRDGQFMHPSDGITLYIREITANGELRDLFLADDRGSAERVTYSARRALLVRGDSGPKLIMFDGMAQSLARGDGNDQTDAQQGGRTNGRLSVTRFEDFTYDLGALITGSAADRRELDELSTLELLNPTPALMEETGEDRAAFLQEGHARISQPLLATAAALIGFSSLLLGAFSRFGLWRQVMIAVAILIVVQAINTVAISAAMRSASAWPLVYSAPVAGVLIAAFNLWLAQRPRRRPRAARTAPAGGAA